MTKGTGNTKEPKSGESDTVPCLSIAKLGAVSRDYGHKYKNGYRDFSHALPDVLKLLDDEGCDAVLFSLFSIVSRDSYDPRACFDGLRNVNAVFLEEFKDGRKRIAGRYVIHHRTTEGWGEYEFFQQFGTLTGMTQADIANFVSNEMQKRVMGKCCVLLCGETNGVKYLPKDKKVKDTFGVRAAIPQEANIVLNPIHDRMTRFEIKLKRKFLSENGRWVVSVWNKGKKDKNGAVRDGSGPAWTIFHNGKQKDIQRKQNELGVEIGILDVKEA